jgi:hypothetical protein
LGTFLTSGENLGQMNGFDAGALAVQSSLNVHEAAVVAGGAGLGAGVEYGCGFFSQHGTGDVGVFDGEGSTEAAAAVHVLNLNEIDSLHRAEKAQRTVSQAEVTQAVAAGVIGDAVRIVGSYIFETEALGEELGELVDARQKLGDLGDQLGVADLFGHLGVVIAYHGHAARGGHDDGLGVTKLFDEASDERKSLGLIAGVPVHLSTTGLTGRKVYGVTKSLEHLDDGNPCVGKQGVVIAGNKQGDLQT